MNLFKIFAFAMLASSAVAQAQTSPFSYNNITIGYGTGSMNVAGSKLNASSMSVSGSASLSENLFITSSYVKDNVEFSGYSKNSNQFALGVGSRVGIFPKTDLISGVSLLNETVKTNGSSDSSPGYALSVGLRHALNDRAELFGHVGLAVVGSFSNRINSQSFGLRYKLIDSVSLIGAFVNSSSQSTTGRLFQTGLRYDF